MAQLVETDCCGIHELNEIMECENAREAIVDAAEEWFQNDDQGAYIFFSTTSDSKIGHAIARYIKKYKLGSVTKTKPTINANTNNLLTMWVWTVNKVNFKAYWLKTNRYKNDYKHHDSDNW